MTNTTRKTQLTTDLTISALLLISAVASALYGYTALLPTALAHGDAPSVRAMDHQAMH